MTQTVNFDGSTYDIPNSGERGWGGQVTAYLVAISTGTLQRAGGLFTLGADVDFGGTFGLKSVYFTSKAAAPSSAGVLRLGNDQAIGWRNAAGNANLLLRANSSDLLTFGGNPVLALALGAAHSVMRMNSDGSAYGWGLLGNDNIDGAAGISWSKVDKTGSNLTDISTRSHSSLTDIGVNSHDMIDTMISSYTAHFLNTSNPHSVTKTQVGLGNVDNTSDATKNSAAVTLTNKVIDGNNNTLTVLAATQLSGQTPIANGGTGQSTANGALNALLPSQTGNGGKVLGSDGTDTGWVDGATSDTQPPIATIVAYSPGYFGNASNGSFTLVGPATNDVTGVNAFLPSNWRVCDGSELNDSGSPIFNGAGRYLPNLTNTRFLAGASAAGATGGAATVTLVTNNLPSHNHSINHDHASATSGSNSVGHTHSIAHDHASVTSGSNSASHTHGSGSGTFVVVGAGGTQYANATGTALNNSVATATQSANHTHSVDLPNFTGNSGGVSANHTHSVDLPNFTGNSGDTGSGTAFDIIPPFLAAFFIMRVK